MSGEKPLPEPQNRHSPQSIDLDRRRRIKWESIKTIGGLADRCRAELDWFERKAELLDGVCPVSDTPRVEYQAQARQAIRKAMDFGISPTPSLPSKAISFDEFLSICKSIIDASPRPEQPPPGKWWNYPVHPQKRETIDPDSALEHFVRARIGDWSVQSPNWDTLRTALYHDGLSPAQVETMNCMGIRNHFGMSNRRVIELNGGATYTNLAVTGFTPGSSGESPSPPIDPNKPMTLREIRQKYHPHLEDETDRSRISKALDRAVKGKDHLYGSDRKSKEKTWAASVADSVVAADIKKRQK